MQTSVTSGSASSGSRARSVRRSADTSAVGTPTAWRDPPVGVLPMAIPPVAALPPCVKAPARGVTPACNAFPDCWAACCAGTPISTPCCDGAELINRPEVEIASHEDLNPIAVALGDGGRDVDRALQDIRHDAFGARGVVDYRPAIAAGRLPRRLHPAVH